MTQDLSLFHHAVSDLFALQERHCFSEEQLGFYEANGYLSGIRLLDDDQVEVLRAELQELADPSHPGNHLFYEYHSNESSDPQKVLFHALGAWRVTRGFHDLLWNPAFLVSLEES